MKTISKIIAVIILILVSSFVVLTPACYVNYPITTTTEKSVEVQKRGCDIWCKLRRIVLYIVQQLLSDD